MVAFRLSCTARPAAPVTKDPRPLYVITHTHSRSLWGLHLESPPKTEATRKTQVVAFEKRRDAELVARRLWAHRLRSHKWPNTILDNRPLWLAGPLDGESTAPSPLAVDEVETEWLLDRMALSSAALSVVRQFDEEGTSFNISYMQSTVPVAQQVSWLQKLFDQPGARK